VSISLGDLERNLSMARLAPYRAGARDDAEAICRYVWNLDLSQAIYPVLHSVEVALRNSIHAAGTDYFGSPEWFRNPRNLRLESRERRMLETARDQLWERQGYSIPDIRRGIIPAPPLPLADDHVAELMLGFWIGLLNAPYQRLLWDTRPRGTNLSSAVFPYAGRSNRQRAVIFPMVNRLRYLRNRVSHHEPIWNWRPSLAAQHQEALRLLAWISPALHAITLMLDQFPTVHSRSHSYYATLVQLKT